MEDDLYDDEEYIDVDFIPDERYFDRDGNKVECPNCSGKCYFDEGMKEVWICEDCEDEFTECEVDAKYY